MMSTTSVQSQTSSPILDALNEVKLGPVPEEMKEAMKPLIGRAFLYVIAAKINNFTGRKISCLRNFEQNSGKNLMQGVNDAFSPILNAKMMYVKAEGQDGLEKVFTEVNKYTLGLAKVKALGVPDLKKNVSAFFNIACDALVQVEQGKSPQTINRMLLILSGIYTGNKDIKGIIDKNKGILLEEFFKEGGVLSHILENNLGKLKFLKGPIEKLVVALGAKQLVDDFATNLVLNGKFCEAITSQGDVYEKLILKGVGLFIKNDGAEKLTLDEILKDDKLDAALRKQIVNLRQSYNKSKLTKGLLGLENSLGSHIVDVFKDKDIIRMSKDDLKANLMQIGTNYFKEGVDSVGQELKKVGTAIANAAVAVGSAVVNAAVAVGSAVGAVVGTLGNCATSVAKKLGGLNPEAEAEKGVSGSSRKVEETTEASTGVAGCILGGLRWCWNLITGSGASEEEKSSDEQPKSKIENDFDAFCQPEANSSVQTPTPITSAQEAPKKAKSTEEIETPSAVVEIPPSMPTDAVPSQTTLEAPAASVMSDKAEGIKPEVGEKVSEETATPVQATTSTTSAQEASDVASKEAESAEEANQPTAIPVPEATPQVASAESAKKAETKSEKTTSSQKVEKIPEPAKKAESLGWWGLRMVGNLVKGTAKAAVAVGVVAVKGTFAAANGVASGVSAVYNYATSSRASNAEEGSQRISEGQPESSGEKPKRDRV